MVKKLGAMLLLAMSLAVTLFTFSSFAAHSAYAASVNVAHSVKAQSCPSASSQSTGAGTGSTPAQVSVTLWKDCSGNYYASANLTKDSNGFAFGGTLIFYYIYPIDNTQQSVTASCNQAGICDTKHVSLTNVWPNQPSISWEFDAAANRGVFYHVTGSAVFVPSSASSSTKIASSHQYGLF